MASESNDSPTWTHVCEWVSVPMLTGSRPFVFSRKACFLFTLNFSTYAQRFADGRTHPMFPLYVLILSYLDTSWRNIPWVHYGVARWQVAWHCLCPAKCGTDCCWHRLCGHAVVPNVALPSLCFCFLPDCDLVDISTVVILTSVTSHGFCFFLNMWGRDVCQLNYLCMLTKQGLKQNLLTKKMTYENRSYAHLNELLCMVERIYDMGERLKLVLMW